jgi:anti-sigma factor RsiW
MRCWRVNLRRSFSLYLNGELSPSQVKRIEDHLLDCASCRARFAQLRSGHRMAQQIPRFTPERDPWASIEATLNAAEVNTGPAPMSEPPAIVRWRGFAIKPGFALAVIGIAALIAAVLIASGKRAPEQERAGSLIADALDLSGFHTVNIADIERNRQPHVVAEGYVSEVRVNGEDGDLSFKLADDPRGAGPFIICEIIDPIKLTPPSVGSRVRVYGVSRYDGQVDHNWYEVHPVLNIEVVRR